MKSRREPKVERLPAWHPHWTRTATGYWTVLYDRAGVRRRISAGRRSVAADAWAVVDAYRDDDDLWHGDDEHEITVDEFMPVYWRVKANRAKASTLRTDRVRWARMQPTFGRLRLCEVTLERVQDFLDALRGAGDRARTTATVNRYHSLVSSILGLALKRGLVALHATRGRLTQKKERPRPPRVLTESEIPRLVEAVRCVDQDLVDPYLELAVLIPLTTGIRPGREPGAVLSLRWSHVDFVRRGFDVPETKRGGRRFYPFGEAVGRLLERRYRARRSETWVFPSPHAERGHLTTIRRPLRRALGQAGLADGVTWYSCRHTLGTTLADTGHPLHVIQDVMGHEDPATTSKYLHAFEHFKRGAVEAMDRLASPPEAVLGNGLTTTAAVG